MTMNNEERNQQMEEQLSASSGGASKKKILYWILIGVFAMIFLVSSCFVIKYLIEDYQHTQKMNGLPDYPTGSRPLITTPGPTTTLPQFTTLPDTIPSVPSTTLPTVPTTVPTMPTEPPAPTEPQMLEEIIPFYEINPDVVGYIYIPDTKISYPVLQRKEDRNYYLYKDIYGNYDACGSIYVREACDVFNPSDNVTLYGHHMASGKMFANVMNYAWSRDFFDSHQYIYFDTLYERHTYQVVCVFKTSGTYGVGFPYHLYDDFTNEDEFNEFINGVRSLAIHDSGIEVKYGDKFICLSTCEYTIENGRMVLVAVRIS